MNKRRQSKAMRCPRCRIHKTLCFCHAIYPIETQTRISIIMHHREIHLTSNTAQLANLVLPKCQIYLRGLPGENFTASSLKLSNLETPLYLFPHENAVDLTPEFLENFSHHNFHLIIPDGSWSQAVKFYRRSPGLSEVICVKLPPGNPGKYKLRKSSDPNRLSTYEAIARALSILENNQNLGEKMESIFDTMVESVIKGRTAFEN